MITDTGRDAIGNFLARENSGWAEYITLGLDSLPLNSARTDLAFEVSRAKLFGYRYDATAGVVYVRGEFTNAYDGPVGEIGLWSPGNSGVRTLFSFDDDEEAWDGAVTYGGGSAVPTYVAVNGVVTGTGLSSLAEPEVVSGQYVLAVDDASSVGSGVSIELTSSEGSTLTMDFTLNGDNVLTASKSIVGDIVDRPLTSTITTTGGEVFLRGLQIKTLAERTSRLVAVEQPISLVADRRKTLTIEMGVSL